MSSGHVPVQMGSPRFLTAQTRTALVTQAWFAPGDTLAPHTHERAILATMLEGSFETAVSRRRLPCVRGTIWTEPAEERHANYIGRRGARVLVIQPDPAEQDHFAPFERFLGEVQLLRHPGIVRDAHRVAVELSIDDDLTPLAADALITGMLTAATRLRLGRRHHQPVPAWLLRVQERLHEGWDLPLTQLAAIGGVHPCHLAHAFRRHFGMTVGEYARQLRLDAALLRLRDSDTPISKVAVASGFADQSHFTRACRSALGITPAEYRRRHRQ